MSFFDKFFSHKSRLARNNNDLNLSWEPLSFRCSTLSIAKEQIRFVLFRECDKRGRKLLFDSNAVEKVSLCVKGLMCNQKCQQQIHEKMTDFIETTSTYGYKYKKLSDDVAYLGEMIFGSVAMIYKGDSSCKIHKIPSPKQLMFTTIIHAPVRCRNGTNSESSMESQFSSVNETSHHKETSSDSKLYTQKEVLAKCSMTYPWSKTCPPLEHKNQCCDDNVNSCLIKEHLAQKNSRLRCFESFFLGNKEPEVKENIVCGDCVDGSGNIESIKEDSSGGIDNLVVASFSSSESENVSSVNGSWSSLRRRWAQSYSTSLELTVSDDNSCTSWKKRTKLGMALVLDLSHTKDEAIETFLYNHTIVIDSIMSKLQSSVEIAYTKNQHFVDLVYTAFLESQQSFYELITGKRFTLPVWITLNGDMVEDPDDLFNKSHDPQESGKASKKPDELNNIKLKFLNDFCDVLVKFDTKDTNFFVSTLLTAVLTHHLSWVTTIAETDISNRHEKMQSVIKKIRPYNPIWAQINDLCGLLGFPLKCSRTIITGNESKKNYITSILQVLSYFVRCYSVVENIYDVNIEDVIGNINSEPEENEVDNSCEFPQNLFQMNKFEESVHNHLCEEKQLCAKKSNICDPVEEISEEKSFLSCGSIQGSMKRSKSFLSGTQLQESVTSEKIYPDIKELIKNENVYESDFQNYVELDKTIVLEAQIPESLPKFIDVPNISLKSHLEENLSPDEGYDTIGSTKAEEICSPQKIEMEKQKSEVRDLKGSITFVLGGSDEVASTPKKLIFTKSDTIDMEREDSKDLISECDSKTSEERINNEKSEGDRTFLKKCCERTQLLSGCSKVKHSLCQCRLNNLNVPWTAREIALPRSVKPYKTRRLDVISVFGGVNQKYNSEQIIQGVTEPKHLWEQTLQKDLFLSAHSSIIEKEVTESLCIVGDMDLWEVSVRSSSTSKLDRKNRSGVRVGMSKLVADMLESFLCLHKINLPPNFCLLHLEKKLHEIYLKSKTVAELLNSSELSSLDYLIASLDIEINDFPLLLSVATTHSPEISKKYGLSFT